MRTAKVRVVLFNPWGMTEAEATHILGDLASFGLINVVGSLTFMYVENASDSAGNGTWAQESVKRKVEPRLTPLFVKAGKGLSIKSVTVESFSDCQED